MVYSYADSNSSYNRHNRNDEDNKRRDEKIKKMEDDLLKAQQIRQETLDVQLKQEQRIESNLVAIGQVARLIPVELEALSILNLFKTFFK